MDLGTGKFELLPLVRSLGDLFHEPFSAKGCDGIVRPTRLCRCGGVEMQGAFLRSCSILSATR